MLASEKTKWTNYSRVSMGRFSEACVSATLLPLSLSHTGIEMEQITLSITSSEGTQNVSWPLRCSMWICHSSHHQKAKGSAQAHPDGVLVTRTLEEVLCINRALAQQIALFVATDPPSQESEDYLAEILTHHMLGAAMEVDRDVVFSDDDFKTLLRVASQVRPVVSKGARNMIKAFYLASRNVRMSSVYGTDVVKSALDSM